MIQRHILPRLRQALADTPVVLVQGARQTGKSTLVKWLVKTGPVGGRYLTMDDPSVLAAASSDPAGFVTGLERPVVLDEVQRAPVDRMLRGGLPRSRRTKRPGATLELVRVLPRHYLAARRARHGAHRRADQIAAGASAACGEGYRTLQCRGHRTACRHTEYHVEAIPHASRDDVSDSLASGVVHDPSRSFGEITQANDRRQRTHGTLAGFEQISIALAAG